MPPASETSGADFGPSERGASPEPDASLSLAELWRRAHSRAQSLRLRRLLAQTTPRERRAGVVVVSIVREIAPMFDASRGALEEALSGELGERVRIEIAPEDGASPSPRPSPAAAASAERIDARDAREGERVEEHPLVRVAMELFNAEIIDVRPIDPAPE